MSRSPVTGKGPGGCGAQVLNPQPLSLCFSFAPAVNLHELCASRVSEILRNKVHRTEEVKDVDFYAFSYYYDLAANVGLIGKGGAEV